MREIKTGDKYICKIDGWTCYIKGNIYEIADVKNKSVAFISELNTLHYIEIYDLMTDFSDLQIELKKPKFLNEIATPKHYNNENGTLYSIAEQRGWNTYLFDIVKRLERAEKKGEFNQDLEKSIAVIQLWKKESKK